MKESTTTAEIEPEPRITDRLGRALRDLRISVTDRCNFRCAYCMPTAAFPEAHKFLPTSALLSFDEIERVARLFVTELGVEKLRLTGGEPLLRPELPKLVERLARIDGLRDLTLTTNAYLLREHASALAAAGLHRLTVSLDSVESSEFARMSGADRKLGRVLEGIDAALAAGLGPLKINCVVIRGQNEASIVALAERFRGTPHIVRFIEYMDVGTQNTWSMRDVVTAKEILRNISERWPLMAAAPSQPGEVASRYLYEDRAGEIGVIASVTAPFCSTCHRARLSADGQLLTCLFAPTGVDIRELLRNGAPDSALLNVIQTTWRSRSDRYSEERGEATQANPQRRRLEMYQIGG